MPAPANLPLTGIDKRRPIKSTKRLTGVNREGEIDCENARGDCNVIGTFRACDRRRLEVVALTAVMSGPISASITEMAASAPGLATK